MRDAEDFADPMTSARATTILREQFPRLADLDVTPLGEGTDHCAFDVGGLHVFRFPKTEEAADALAIEARLTRWLAPALPLAIPSYQFFGQPSDRFPRVFAGYARLAGIPALLVDPDAPDRPDQIDIPAIGHELGRFLRALHGMDVATAEALGLPADDDPTLAAWSSVALADLDLASAHGHIDPSARAGWERVLATRPAAGARPARVIHGDLAAEHVLLGAHGAPAAVIDWSDACVGDPALDIAGMIHWGGARLLSLTLATYGPVDDAVLARARWFAACRAFADIAFGEHTQRPAYVLAGQRALAWLRSWLTG